MSKTEKPKYSIPMEGELKVQLYPFGMQCKALTDEDLTPQMLAFLEESRPEIFNQLVKS